MWFKIAPGLSSFQILDEIEEHNIKIYHLPDAESDEDEDFKEQTRLLKVRVLSRCLKRVSPVPVISAVEGVDRGPPRGRLAFHRLSGRFSYSSIFILNIF